MAVVKNKLIISLIIGVIVTLIIKRQAVKSAVKEIEATGKKVIDMLTRKEFITKFSDSIKSAAQGTGLFPSLMMAQAIVESNNGNSTLSSKYNNFFGIKADTSWTGAKALMKTREVIDGKSVMVDAPFRAYKSPLDSFKDRIKFLQGFSRYKPLFVAKTPEAQAQVLLTAGYATDPKYATTLINVIKDYNLKSLDV